MSGSDERGVERRVRIGNGAVDAMLVDVEGELDRAGWTGVLRDLQPPGAMVDPDTELHVLAGPNEGASAAIHVDQHFDETVTITGVSRLR